MTFHFLQGFINDDFAKISESVHSVDFLYTGKRPVIGQRTETQIFLSNEIFFRMTGEITQIFPSPSIQVYDPEEEIKRFGARNGQVLIGISELSPDFYSKKLPLKKGQRFQISYRLNEQMKYAWIVESIISI